MSAPPDGQLVSVIIPAWNADGSLKACLDAIARSTYPHYECIVVNDGSTDDTAQIACQRATKVITNPASRGPSQARNIGAKAAQGEILIFVDADVCIPPDTLGQFISEFNRNPQVAAAFGSYDDAPPEPNFISQYKNLFHHFVHQSGNESASTFWSGCGAIRREVFLHLGGFNEDYVRPCIEDIELGTRLKAAGHTIRLKKDIQVKHLKRWTLWSLIKSDILDRGIPWTMLIFRNRHLPNDLNLRASQQISTGLAFLLTFSLVGSLVYGENLSAVSPALLWLPAFLLLGIIAINFRLYTFFYKRKTLWFILGAIPLHILYFLYSGMAFVAGAVLFQATSRRNS